MALSDDNSVFIGGEFGVPVSAGSVNSTGVLRQPSEVIVEGMVLFTDYLLDAKASDFGTLVANDSITVDSTAYTVRETRFSTDGQLVTISLQKT